MSRVTQVGGYGRKGIKRGRQADRKETERERRQIQSAGASEPRRWPIGRQDPPAAGPSAASAIVSAAARSPFGTLGSDAPSAARNANSFTLWIVERRETRHDLPPSRCQACRNDCQWWQRRPSHQNSIVTSTEVLQDCDNVLKIEISFLECT